MNVWTVKLEEKEFIRGHQIYLRRTLLTAKNGGLLLIAFLMVVAQAQVLGPSSYATWVIFALFLALIGFLLTVYIEMPSRLYRRRAELRNQWQIAFFEDGIEVIQTSGSQVYPHGHPLKVVQSSEMWILQLAGGLPLVIPKRILAERESNFVEAIKQFQAHGVHSQGRS